MMTSGALLNKLAQALRHSYATEIGTRVVARTLPHTAAQVRSVQAACLTRSEDGYMQSAWNGATEKTFGFAEG